MNNIKFLTVIVIFFLIFSTDSFSQEDKKSDHSTLFDIYLGYSYNNLNNADKYLSFGSDFIQNGAFFVKPLFNFEFQFGLSDVNTIYSLNFAPGIRCLFGSIDSYNFYYEATAGLSAMKHPRYPNVELGLSSKLGIGFGYKNFLINIDLKYMQSKDIIINPITIGFKYYLP